MNTRRRRGIFTLDAAMGLAIIAILGGILTTALVQHSKIIDRFADQRSATRAAEAALLQLQTGESPDPPLEIHPFDTPAPPGEVWVRVRATSGGRQVELIGLVPAAAQPEARP